METWGQWILKNVKTCWISMLSLAKKVLFKYCVMVLKMHLDVNIITKFTHNLELLCNFEVMVGLSCIMPILERLNEFIIFF
jgi:hypothetical protein